MSEIWKKYKQRRLIEKLISYLLRTAVVGFLVTQPGYSYFWQMNKKASYNASLIIYFMNNETPLVIFICSQNKVSKYHNDYSVFTDL